MPATIRLGSTGEDVKRWQDLLNGAGYRVQVTSTFDAATDAATRSWQASRGLTADGVVGQASWAGMIGAAPDPLAAYCRAAIVEAWPRVTGQQPNLAELQIAAANAHLESACGRASYTNKITGEKATLNNWGAVQAGKPPCDPARSFEATDTRADGTPYQWCYARYATPADGAAEMIRQMTVRRPTSWRHMRAGDIDAWAAAMRTTDPETGVGLYFEQSAAGRAAGIDQRVRSIAAAFGEPIAATRGGPPRTTPAGTMVAAGGIGWLIGLGGGLLVGAELVAPGIVMRGLRQVRGLLARRNTP